MPNVVAPLTRTVRPQGPVDLRLTLGPLRFGRRDRTIRVARGEVWRATRTPDGGATVRLVSRAGAIDVEAWGPGASWALDHAPALVGVEDGDRTADTFDPSPHPLVAGVHRRLPGLRIPRTAAVMEALAPTVIAQKVVGIEARMSWDAIVARAGEPAPGPLGLRLPPAPAALVRLPTWTYHRAGIERKRADTVRRAASVARRLEEAVDLDAPAAAARLGSVPGVGAWTVAEVAIRALGDADAVSVGDYHLPHLVSWNLTGEPRGDDDRMLELLEPFRPHRGRVLRLLEAGGRRAPRYGPRMPLRDVASDA